MALDTKPKGVLSSATTVEVVSPRGVWALLHDNAKSTAQSGIEYRNQTQAGARWTPVPKNRVRVMPRLRWTANGTVSQTAILTLVGYWGSEFDGDFPLQGSGEIHPLHTSITLGGTAVADDADGTDSAVWDYGELSANGGDGYDLYGASYVIAFCTQAATGPTDVDVQGLFL